MTISLQTDSKPLYYYDEKNRCLRFVPYPELYKQFIFHATEKIIDDLVQQIFKIIEDSLVCDLTVKAIAAKLKEKTISQRDQPEEPLTVRQQQFRTYLSEKVLRMLKAPAPPHVRQNIVLAMSPFDEQWVESTATKRACKLLARLDAGSPEIVDQLMMKKESYERGKDEEQEIEENKSQEQGLGRPRQET